MNTEDLRKEEFINDKTTRVEKLLYDKEECESELKNIELFISELNKLSNKSVIAREKTESFLTTLKEEAYNLNEIIGEIDSSIHFVQGY